MTSKKDLDIEFKNAVDLVNDHTDPFPADFLLRLYAYYKKATSNYDRPSSRKPIINAFKANALFQIKNISREQAKVEYINLVNTYFLYRK
ncbi:acyl-CoA-binding protein [Winogradskyella rapida]|uniref:Acyl-CoA-binding protein n=1 Tax=Winogradskyella rapida TaxID=549701 RepID=A0ABW3KTR6_9FLAO